jgi:flavin reductase (DIM6/NTAB) family NADH-FMN oxidoreductase RutF
MVSCRYGEEDNILTVSWTGTICTNPPMLSISIRPTRHSYDIIKKSGEFVVNIPGKSLAFAADFCGVRSGKDVNKFEYLKLTKEKASIVNAPLIGEAPLGIECRVKDILELGSHHMFIAEVVALNVEEALIDSQNSLDLDRAELICYNHGKYCIASNAVGSFGFSVKKKKTTKRVKKVIR